MNESRNMEKRHTAFSMKVRTDAMEAITNGLCEQCKVRVVLISPPLILPGSDNNDLTPAGSLQTASRRAGMRPLFAQRHSGTTNKDKSGFGAA